MRLARRLARLLRDAVTTIRELVTSQPPAWVIEARRMTEPPKES